MRDAEGGEEFDVRATNVVNATGVWADELRPDELHDEAELPQIRPSRGTHIILRDEDLPLVSGAIVPAGGERTIFALPWLGRTLIGTTDNDYEGPLEHVRPSEDDVDYLLSAANDFFGNRARGERRCGCVRRRAPADLDGRQQEVSRHLAQGGALRDLQWDDHDHRRQAHDLAADGEDDRRQGGRTRSARGALPHARNPARPGDRGGELPRLAGVPERAYPALAERYGHTAFDVLALAAASSELAAPIVTSQPDLLAEVVLAARSEQALTVGDVLLRRTRLGILAARELLADAPPSGELDGPVNRVVQALGQEHGWDAARRAQEAARFAEEAQAEGLIPKPSIASAHETAATSSTD